MFSRVTKPSACHRKPMSITDTIYGRIHQQLLSKATWFVMNIFSLVELFLLHLNMPILKVYGSRLEERRPLTTDIVDNPLNNICYSYVSLRKETLCSETCLTYILWDPDSHQSSAWFSRNVGINSFTVDWVSDGCVWRPDWQSWLCSSAWITTVTVYIDEQGPCC